jgi:hypothetical protein
MGCGSSSAGEPGAKNGEFDDGTYAGNRKTGKGAPEDAGFFEEEEEQVGQEFMATKPWIGAVKEPDNHNDVNKEKCEETYALEYVYGYRSADSRQNVHLNPAGNVVYMTAALGVILDP